MLFVTLHLVSLFAGLSSPSFAAAKAPPKAPEPSDRPLVSQVLKDNLSGIASEPVSERERVSVLAQEYLAFLRAKPHSPPRRQKLAKCEQLADSRQDPFCWFILTDLKRVKKPGLMNRLKGWTQARRSVKLARDLMALRLDHLDDLEEPDFTAALKRVGSTEKLQPLAVRLLDQDSCVSSHLLTALGFKLEESFPEDKYKKWVKGLYAKAIRCSRGVAAVKAAYRLGLIQIWDGSYTDADETLEKILNNQSGVEYHARAAYWRWHCARAMSNEALATQMQARLAKDYSFSLHGVLAGVVNAGGTDPVLMFRSKNKPELNSIVHGVEALQAAGAPDDATADILEAMMPDLAGSEPEFRLYVAVLFKRAGDVIHKFQLLASVIRERPDVVAQPTLEMLYPLRNFDVIRQAPGVSDPYLFVSLIRQESAFNEKAKSRAGALGLMQLMPQTARLVASIRKKKELLKPEVNVRAGVRFFSMLMEKYEGDPELALAAYNAGSERVDDWKRRYPIENRLLFLDLIPFRETREYVASIARNYFWYLRIYEKDGSNRVPASRTEFPVLRLMNSRSL